MELTNEQGLAVGAILRSKERILRLGGAAGTGKSVCVAEIAKRIPVEIVTPTWKAALVLREKGYQEARTIHNMLFRPYHKDGELRFTVDGQKASGLGGCLLVVDESSMVDEWTYTKILKHWDGRILFVGDHYQLPPIKAGFSTMEKPDYTLEEVHRQAKGNPIIELATKIRNRESWSWGNYAPMAEAVRDGYQAIVYTNKKRCAINHGVTGSRFPETGDKIIVLENKPKEDVYNGMIMTLDAPLYQGDYEVCQADGISFKANTRSVLRERTVLQDEIYRCGVRHIGAAVDYAYAITCHKAQGSSFENVVTEVRDDPRWFYTAVTRATTNLILDR